MVLNTFPNIFYHWLICPQKAVLRERGSSCKHLIVFVSIHTSSLTFVLPKKKGGNNAAAFAIAPRRQWGKKRICVQSNRHTELNLPLAFLLPTSVSYKYHYAFIFLLLSHCSCTSSTIKHRLWTKACARRIAKLNNGSRHLRTWNATRQAYDISVGNIRFATTPSLTKERHP